MAAAFLKNLLATDKFLGQISRLASAKAVQAEQCKHLELQVQRAQWTTEEAAQACEAIASLSNLTEESKEKITAALAARLAAPQAEEQPVKEGKKARVSLQDYRNLVCMLTPPTWKYLLDEQICPEQACMLVCKYANSLGLVHPTESTVGVITLLSHWSLWRSQEIPQGHKFLALQQCKAWIRKYLATYNLQRPVAQSAALEILPKDFNQLPGDLKAAFHGECLDRITFVCDLS